MDDEIKNKILNLVKSGNVELALILMEHDDFIDEFIKVWINNADWINDPIHQCVTYQINDDYKMKVLKIGRLDWRYYVVTDIMEQVGKVKKPCMRSKYNAAKKLIKKYRSDYAGK